MNQPRHHEQEYTPFEGTPFGYLFTTGGDEPAPMPEAPARGEPLLNDFELDSSHQFFDRFQNDQFGDDAKLFESLRGLQQEPAPNFHGVTSSLGNVSDSSRSLNFGHVEHELNMRMDQANLTSPSDQLPPHNILSYTSASYAPYPAERPVHSRHYSGVLGTRDAFGQPVTISRTGLSRQSAPALPHDTLNFGGDQSFSVPPTVRNRSGNAAGQNAVAPTLGFGSDQNFQNQSYVAPRPNLEDLRTAENTMEAHMRLLEEHSAKSTETTAPSSPTLNKSKRRLSEDESIVNIPGPESRNGRTNSSSHSLTMDKRPRKVKLEDIEDDSDISRAQSSRKGNKGSKTRTSSAGGASQASRRKSQLGDKPPRQNLTEEEKKRNHIRSEQKRRNQIKDGFAALITLMPNTVAAGSSKCAILSQAVEWLRGLIEGNETLRTQLREMGD